MHCDLNLEDIYLDPDFGTVLGCGKQYFEILSNRGIRSYDPDELRTMVNGQTGRVFIHILNNVCVGIHMANTSI